MNEENIEKAISDYRRLLEILIPEIEKASETDSCVPTTIFAKEHCAKFNVEWSVLYNQIKMFVASNSDELEVKLGPKGGVHLKKIVESPIKIINS